MHSARDLMGRPVLDISTGRELGKVNGVLIDPAIGQLAALRVDQGLLHSDRFVRWSDLQGAGKDALTVSTDESLLTHKDVDPNRAFLDQLHGNPVFTESGERLGTIADYRMDTNNGTLTGVEIQPTDAPRRLFGASDSANVVVPRDQIVTLGKESVVVRNDVRESLHGPVKETPTSG